MHQVNRPLHWGRAPPWFPQSRCSISSPSSSITTSLLLTLTTIPSTPLVALQDEHRPGAGSRTSTVAPFPPMSPSAEANPSPTALSGCSTILRIKSSMSGSQISICGLKLARSSSRAATDPSVHPIYLRLCVEYTTWRHSPTPSPIHR
jgi:hypothetical protein